MSELKSRADLFEAAAKMMRMCDEDKHYYVYKFDGLLYRGLASDSFMYQSARYEFPLAFVEGKPVFKGDELYHNSGKKYVVQEVEHHPNGQIAFRTVHEPWIDGDWIENYSWLPPKPRTVMVELLREDAERIADNAAIYVNWAGISEACHKALEELK